MKRKDSAPPLPSHFAGPGDSPGFLLWRLSNAWQRRQRSALLPLGLTHSQFVVLAASTWFSASQELTQARLAELTGIDPMTTSQVVRALEAAELLQRRTHSADPRAKSIAVTPNGRQLARKALRIVEDVDHRFFATLGKDQLTLVELFRRLTEPG